MSSCTRCRPTPMQTCPEFVKLPKAPHAAAASASASPRTTRALLPPSSRWARVRDWAARAPIARPAGVEPVNDTTLTRGSSIMAVPTSTPPGSRWKSPLGTPASSRIRARITPPHTLVRWSGLSRTALPTASAGATERMDRTSGTLKGEMTATTPTGSRRSRLIRGWGECSSSPWGAVASCGGPRHSSAHTWASRRPRPRVPPDSRVTHSTISSACSWNSSAARRRTPARSNAPRAAHSRCAATAMPAASRTSSGAATPIEPSTWPVAGSLTTAWPPPPGRQVPVKMLADHGDASSSFMDSTVPFAGDAPIYNI